MPIDSKHETYKNMIPLQEKCRVVTQGEDAVKAAGTAFLPMLGGQKVTDYDAYKDRASFFNASGRTLEGLTGVVFRKPPKVEFPIEGFLDSVTVEGDDHMVFLRQTVKEMLQAGRLGLLADIKEELVMPHVAVYQAEAIINWRTEMINGEKTLIMLVLQEDRWSYDDDAFEPEQEILYRVLVLTDDISLLDDVVSDLAAMELKPSIDPDSETKLFYATALYKKEKNKTDARGKPIFTLVEGPFVPNVRGKRIEYIPFVAVNPTNLSIDRIDNPPILDVVNLNLSHYRLSADLKHGLHFTALPTAWVAGFKTDQELRIGSQTAWVSDDPNAHAGYLEFTGAGLSSIRDEMKDISEQMAIVGSRLLEEPKRAVEASDTHRQRKSGEESVVGALAGNIESAVEKVFKWCAEWMLENPDDVDVTLNKDYISQLMDPAMLTALMMALQQSRISFDTFIYNLQQGELLPDGRTAEEELELIQQNPAMPSLEGPSISLEDEDDEDEMDEEDEIEGEEA